MLEAPLILVAMLSALWLLDSQAVLVRDLCFETWSQPYDPAELLAKIEARSPTGPKKIVTVAQVG